MGYLSHLSALLRSFRLIQILRSPDGFVAIITSVTHSVGASIGAVRLILWASLVLAWVFSAKGTCLEGPIFGDILGSTSNRWAPGRVPRSPSKISWYSSMNWSVVFNLSAPHVGCLMPATCTKFCGCISRSPMCWLAFAPRSGINFSFTTTNTKEYFLSFLGFWIMTPSLFNSDLFHIWKTFLVGLISLCPTYFTGSTLTVTPQSTWKRIAFPFWVISA